MAKHDYYTVLNVRPDASAADIKSAYHGLAMRWHPDRCRELNANTRFQEINEAYECLKDEKKRAAYDTARQKAQRDADARKRKSPPSPRPPWRTAPPRARSPYALFAAALISLLAWHLIAPGMSPPRHRTRAATGILAAGE